MQYLFDAEEMQDLDTTAIETYGIPGIVLMEHAAAESWRVISEMKPRTIVVFAGPGNNGGDGLALARMAAISGRCTLVVVAAGCERAASGSPTAIHMRSCRELGIPIRVFRSDQPDSLDIAGEADLVVDAVLGTGLKQPVREKLFPAFDLIAECRKAGARVVSLDLPSGLRDGAEAPERSVVADDTLTFGWAKRVLYSPWGRSRAGNIHCLDIGFPKQLEERRTGPTLQLADTTDLGRYLNPIPAAAHKGVRGHTAVLAGSEGMTGAARLCSEAAVRARAALVTLYSETIPEGMSASIMTRFSQDIDAALNQTHRRIDAIAAGPGWGRHPSRVELVSKLPSYAPKGVLDADALAALADAEGVVLKDWVLTPHPAEAARLAGCSLDRVQADPVSTGRELAKRYECTVVIKAQASHIVAANGDTVVVDGNLAALACGGSGDVLAGVIGGILAGGGSAFDASVAGVLAHAEAGRRLFRRRGWFNADDLPLEISRVLAGIREPGAMEHEPTAWKLG